MNEYEKAKAQLIADHVYREGTNPLSKAEEFVLKCIDFEQKEHEQRKANAYKKLIKMLRD